MPIYSTKIISLTLKKLISMITNYYTKICLVKTKTKTELFANPIIRTLNLLYAMRSCLNNNYYYVNVILITMKIKREILMTLNH